MSDSIVVIDISPVKPISIPQFSIANRVEWAHSDNDDYRKSLVANPHAHWSRLFEYPWMMRWGQLDKGLSVLDAAGGNSQMQLMIANEGCSVTNIDMEVPNDTTPYHPSITRIVGNCEALPVADESFDRVVCVSALEHMNEPLKAIRELKRVLKKGGRLLVSLDVASYSRWNHNIDEVGAGWILEEFGMSLPEFPADGLQANFEEINPKADEPKVVTLRVLCFWWDKP